MKKILEVLGSDWTGPMLTPFEKLGQFVAFIVSYPFLKGAKLIDKL